MRINNNIAALNTYGKMVSNGAQNAKSLEKLSSGLRINKAGDDAAGLSISEKMRAQIRGLDQASRNAQDSISMIQTAEGALNETESILQRMRELSVQSSNATNTDSDRGALQSEITQLKDEIDRIGNTTEFNTKKLLNGSLQSSSTGTTDLNSTVGAQVLKQTSAKVTSDVASFKAGDYSGVDVTKKDTLRIDQTNITIDWESKLTSGEKALLDSNYSVTNMTDSQKSEIKDAVSRVINESIDDYNAANGASVNHVKIYESNNALVIESGKEGQNSQVYMDANNGSIMAEYFDSDDGGLTAAGDDIMQKDLASGTTLSFEVNGVHLKTSGLSGATAAASTDADTVATDIQTKLRTAIDNYNTDAGLSSGQAGFIDKDSVIVSAENGRFTVKSGSGAIQFNEVEGETVVKDLGLTSAQTEASGNGALTFQIGSNRGQTMDLGINDMRSQALGVASINISSKDGASLAIDTLDKAITKVSGERSKLGAVQNRLEHTINNLATSSENLNAAESRIRDVDMAKEMMQFTKTNILNQAAQAMMAQANQQPQGVLQLLR